MLTVPIIVLPVRTVVAATVLAVCVLSTPDAVAKTTVVTSIPPIAMLVSEIGGERVSVDALITGASTPHNYSPRPSDAAAVARADLVLYVGGGLDEWVTDMTDAGSRALVVELIPHEPGATHGAHADPHAWLDPSWTRDRMVPTIVRSLSKLDPAAAPIYEAEGRRVAERLTNLEEDIRQMLLKATVRSFVAFHPAWGHFAKRFDLKPLGAIEESGGEEPTLRSLTETMRAARSAGVRAILIEPQMDARVARTLADELGATVVTVDPFGDIDSFDRDTYQDLMFFNAAAFAHALAVSGE